MVSDHLADLLAELIYEDADSVGTGDSPRQLTHCLRHKTRLQTDVAVPHIPLYFALRSKGGHGVNDKDVYRRRTDQLLCNLQRLLSVVRLRDKKIGDIDSELLGIETVKGVFGINHCSDSSGLLSLRNGVECKSSLT